MIADRYTRFMPIAQALANTFSKDQSLKVGALVLDASMDIRSTGWNGAARGCKADEDDRTKVRPEKYFWMVHAEANAVYNAARNGRSLLGCTMVVTATPCMNCANAIVQAGIAHVIAKANPDYSSRWAADVERTLKLFEECSILYEEIP